MVAVSLATTSVATVAGVSVVAVVMAVAAAAFAAAISSSVRHVMESGSAPQSSSVGGRAVRGSRLRRQIRLSFRNASRTERRSGLRAHCNTFT